jgi:signal transduction histidine kinase
VLREIDRMDGYVRDLLAYVRPQTDSMRALDPMTVVDNALAKRGAVLQRHGIAVRRDDRRAGGSQALVDPVLLEHAVTTIVDNAIEVMPNGGTLTVTASGRPRNGEVSLEILDKRPRHSARVARPCRRIVFHHQIPWARIGARPGTRRDRALERPARHLEPAGQRHLRLDLAQDGGRRCLA